AVSERCGVRRMPRGPGADDLAVRELPEQEVADALLAASAHEQIGLRGIAHREVRRELFLADLGRQRSRGGEAAQGLQDVPAAAVVRRDGQRQAAVVCREPLALLDQEAD